MEKLKPLFEELLLRDKILRLSYWLESEDIREVRIIICEKDGVKDFIDINNTLFILDILSNIRSVLEDEKVI